MRARLPFVVSAVFHYLGPAFAVLLFVRVDVLGVAWLRIAAAALVFALWRRPWQLLRDRDVLAWGAVLAAMNCCFYLAIDRLPLATVASIEFLPVIVLAALGMRTRRNMAALALAVAGVYLLTGVHLVGRSARASRWPSRTRGCSPPTSCSRTGSRHPGRRRRAGGGDDRRARVRDADGGLGGAARVRGPGRDRGRDRRRRSRPR